MSLLIVDKMLYFNDEFIGVLDNTFALKCDNFIEIDKPKWIVEITKLASSDMLENLEIMFKGDRNYYNCWKKGNKTFVSVDKEIDVLEWNNNISIRSFYQLFPKNTNKDSKFDFEIEFDEKERYLNIFITLELNSKDTIDDGIRCILDEYRKKENKTISSNLINREMNFSAEHLTSGIAILQYFGKILQEKYPNENASVSIKQEGLNVSMTIETPDGKKEEIQEYLDKFGRVVTNQITPQEFVSNPIQLLELETKLQAAQLEIGFQKKLLALQDKTYDVNLVSIKDEVQYLRNELSSLRVDNNENLQLLLSSINIKDKLIKKLIKSVEKKEKKETKALLMELKEKDVKGYTSLKEHLDTAIIGGMVNAPSWVQFLIKIVE